MTAVGDSSSAGSLWYTPRRWEGLSSRRRLRGLEVDEQREKRCLRQRTVGRQRRVGGRQSPSLSRLALVLHKVNVIYAGKKKQQRTIHASSRVAKTRSILGTCNPASSPQGLDRSPRALGKLSSNHTMRSNRQFHKAFSC